MQHSLTRRQALILGLAAAIVGLAPPVRSGTIYVTTNGAGAGASWADATSLTNALRICQSNDALWLAQGTYTNSATFAIASNGVSLYGGFTNGMATFGERNWTNYPAILDGNSNNWRVVTVSGANVTLEGLVISNSYGSSAGGLTKTVAGALTLANCRIVRHEGRNANMQGIGCYFTAGSVLMTNCVVAKNTISNSVDAAHSGFGFGVYANGADLQIVDCSLSDHYGNGTLTRTATGVGLWFDQGNLQVLRTSFTNNAAGANNFYGVGGGGSAVYLGNSATFSAVFSNCVFQGNAGLGGSGQGAGAVAWIKLADSTKTAAFVNCTFAFNTNFNGNGGAFYISAGTVELRNSLLWSNNVTAGGTSGREIYMAGGTLRASHCGITGTGLPHVNVNSGSLTLSPVMTNDPLFASATDLHLKSVAGRWENGSWVNDAVYSPGIDASDPSDPVGSEPSENGGRRNLGVYGGTAQASKSPGVAPLVVNRPVLTNAYTQVILRGELTNDVPVIATVGICYGTNSIAEPVTSGWQYVTQLYPPRQTGTVFTTTTSYLLTNTTYYYRAYATNAFGTNWAPVESFLTATNYPPLWGVGGGSDVIHVRSVAVGEANGNDWYNAYTTIGDGIAAISGTRTNIWITGATYSEGVMRTLATSAMIVGGFAAGETAVAQRPTNALGIATNYTVMNGVYTYRCLSVTNGNVWIDTVSFSNSPSGRALSKTGSGALVLNNCRFERNYGDNTASGGGAYLSGGTVRMMGCQIVSNQCDSSGVGLYFSGATVLMTNCVVARNRHGFNYPEGAHSQLGIGVYANGCTMDIVDCVFQDQLGDLYGTRTCRGGGLAFDNGTLRVTRTDFIGNRGVGHPYSGMVGGGGAVYLGNSANISVVFSNCVFRANKVMKTTAGGGTPGWGGAVQANLTAASTAAFVNCTFAFNTNDYGSAGAIYATGGVVVLENVIVWSNRLADASAGVGQDICIDGAASRITNSYGCFTGTNAPLVVSTNSGVIQWGPGILISDPLFAGSGDLHLQSRGGRWDPVTTAWTNDAVSSPCIDTGDPADPVRSETMPNGGKINMGAYGGTAQASRSEMPQGTLFIFQ